MAKVPKFFNDLPNSQVWLAGSHLYGLSTKKSDKDYGAIFFSPENHVDPFYNDNVTHTNSTNDYWAHDLSKYARLLYKGNPTLIDLVFAEPIKASELVSEFLSVVRPHVLHQGLASSYMGYITNQKNRGLMFRQRENQDRLARVEELGYDPKFVSHLFRLVYQARRVLNHHEYANIAECDAIRDFLLAVKKEHYTLSEIESMVEIQVGLLEDDMRDRHASLPTNQRLKEVAREFFVSYFS